MKKLNNIIIGIIFTLLIVPFICLYIISYGFGMLSHAIVDGTKDGHEGNDIF